MRSLILVNFWLAYGKNLMVANFFYQKINKELS